MKNETIDTRVGYMTLSIIKKDVTPEYLKEKIMNYWNKRDIPEMLYHINIYNSLHKGGR